MDTSHDDTTAGGRNDGESLASATDAAAADTVGAAGNDVSGSPAFGEGPGSAASAVTRRVTWRSGDRPAVFVSPTTTASELLAAHDPTCPRVYVVGAIGDGTRAGVRSWAAALDPAGRWSPDERGHYIEDGAAPTLRFVYHHEIGTRSRVSVMAAGAWFGHRGSYDRGAAERAWWLLDRLVAEYFDGGRLADSPGATGRRLFGRVIPRGVEYPCLPLDAQRLIHDTSGQGRIELLDGPAELPRLVEYDGRVMYLALCRELGSGLAEHREWAGCEPDDLDLYAPAWYRVTATVPRGWDHVGLLPAADGRDRWGRRSWRYPDQPGETLTAWATGAELHLALRHEWRVRVHERLLFGAGRPLDGWQRRAAKALERCQRRTETAPDEPWHLVRAGMRAIVLHAIGAFFARSRAVTRSAPLAEQRGLPPDAANVRAEGDRLVWTELAAPAWAEMAHPEWSAQVYGRARARLCAAPRGAGALSVPRSELVAFRTDAIYMSSDPRWHDDGQPGRYRHVRTVAGPMPRPTSHAELLKVRDGA